jgi:hypothetical protein
VLAGKTLAALAVVMVLLLMTAGDRNRLADSNSNTSVRFLGISFLYSFRSMGYILHAARHDKEQRFWLIYHLDAILASSYL